MPVPKTKVEVIWIWTIIGGNKTGQLENWDIYGILGSNQRNWSKKFDGIVNYCGRFLENLNELTNPIRQLVKESVKWTDIHDKAFNTLKQKLHDVSGNSYFDAKQETHLICRELWHMPADR